MSDRDALETWSLTDAAETYGIRTWGHEYFDISSDGEVTISLACGERRKAVSPHRIYRDIKARGLTPPVLLRFSDVLDAAIIGASVSIVSGVLVILGVSSSAVGFVVDLSAGVQELALAFYLIIKGFRERDAVPERT